MIEMMYKKNLEFLIPEIKELAFPDILRCCRELMGLKQYAAADYLGFDSLRYRKLESGRFSEPLSILELKRLESFYKTPHGILKKKQLEFLNKPLDQRKEHCKKIWDITEKVIDNLK